MGHNTVSHTVTHKYKSCVGYWVHYQKIAIKSKGLMDAQCTYAPHAFPLGATRVFLSARNVLNKHARIYAMSLHCVIDHR